MRYAQSGCRLAHSALVRGTVGLLRRRSSLDAEQEAGLVEHRAQRHLDAVLEAAVGAPLLVEAEQRLHFLARGRAPIRAARQRRQDRSARTLLRSPSFRGPAGEDPLAARRVADAARVERSRNRHAVQRRLRSRRAIAVVAGEIRLPLGFDERRRPLDERHLHDMRSAGDARAEVEMRVGRLLRRVLRRDGSSSDRCAAPVSA